MKVGVSNGGLDLGRGLVIDFEDIIVFGKSGERRVDRDCVCVR